MFCQWCAPLCIIKAVMQDHILGAIEVSDRENSLYIAGACHPRVLVAARPWITSAQSQTGAGAFSGRQLLARTARMTVPCCCSRDIVEVCSSPHAQMCSTVYVRCLLCSCRSEKSCREKGELRSQIEPWESEGNHLD